MWRRAELAVALLAGLAVAPGAAGGHEAPSLDDEFVKGVFSPNFVPPAAGSYELPPVKRVAGFVLKDSTGRAVSTERITAGEENGGGLFFTPGAARRRRPPAVPP